MKKLLLIIPILFMGCSFNEVCIPEVDVDAMHYEYSSEAEALREELEWKEEAYDGLVDCVIEEYDRLDIIYACEL